MVDVEVGLMALLDDLGYTVTFVDWRDLQNQIDAHGGVLRIRRIGGGGDRDTDNPTVSIQSYANETQANPRAAHDLDGRVWQRFLDILNGAHDGWAAEGVLIENPDKTSGPVELPSTEPTITVVESLYRLDIRN